MSGSGRVTAFTPEWLRLPRSDALTDALLAVAPASSLADARAADPELHESLRALERGPDAAPAARSPWRGRLVKVGAYQLGAATRPPVAPAPFSWSAPSARRGIALPAVRALVEGSAATPAEAVASMVCGPGPVSTELGPGLRDWVAGLPGAAVAAVAAEATAWATRLWSALDWSRLGPLAEVGPRDEWWHRGHGPLRLALRGRCEVRVRREDAYAHFSVTGGWPSASSRVELLLSALVAALREPRSPMPSVVVGWWPDCGRAWLLPVDGPGLAATARAVAAAALAG
jgi:hypothetical protein